MSMLPFLIVLVSQYFVMAHFYESFSHLVYIHSACFHNSKIVVDRTKSGNTFILPNEKRYKFQINGGNLGVTNNVCGQISTCLAKMVSFKIQFAH